MYDKYQLGNSFGIDTQLPRHKGFLFNSSGAATATANFYLVNAQGRTFPYAMGFSTAGPNIVPINAYAINSLGVGLTGLYLN